MSKHFIPEFKNDNTVLLYEDESRNVYVSLKTTKEEVVSASLKKLGEFCQALDQTKVLKNTYYPSLIIMPSQCISIGEWIAKMNQDQHPLDNPEQTMFVFSGAYVVCTTLDDLINNRTELWWNDAYQCVLANDLCQMYHNNKQHIIGKLPPSFKDSTVFFNPSEILFINKNGDYKMMYFGI